MIPNSNPNTEKQNTGQKLTQKANENENIDIQVQDNMKPPRIKGKKLGRNFQEEISPSFISNSNDVIFFKIVHSDEEFTNFNNLSNLDHTFNPIFTNQIFPEEKITGYKNLKILISLTPKRLYPHIKITYDVSMRLKDDIDLLLKNHYEHVYLKDQQKFLSLLKEEIEGLPNPTGTKLYEEEIAGRRLEIYKTEILKDDALKENWNFQALITYFIDGASFIPIEEGFWNYFILVERRDNQNYHTLGYSSVKNFHMDLELHRSMISQFLIIPPFQRQGLGHFLLNYIYNYFKDNDSNCTEVTTEDPGSEFILLRDVTLFKQILFSGEFDKVLDNLSGGYIIPDRDTYEKFTMTKKDLQAIAKKLKVQDMLVRRCLYILKFISISSSLQHRFKEDIKEMLFRMNREDFEIESMFKKKRKGPFISFHDEPDFDAMNEMEEIKLLNHSEQSKNEKLDSLLNEYEDDLKKISSKCQKLVQEYRTTIKKK